MSRTPIVARAEAGRSPSSPLAAVWSGLAALGRRIQALEARRPDSGRDGVGISDALIDDAGHLVLTLTNGETKRLARVVGRDGETPEPLPGPPGRSIVGAALDERGHLILAFSDGADEDVGLVVKEGPPGDSVRGDDGVGIAGAELRSGNLVLALTDGTERDVGRVAGKDGEPGKPGKPGLPGKPAAAVAVPEVSLGESYSANLSPTDLPRLRLRDITVNGETFQVLCRD